ncbi:uncharacterized protein NEPG_00504 [Nematocida parisii ERTm1]|uniref:Uncharacterized protein n=1 Tax=Nematocida parisii (strain ERTm3) TaxID=935791 RepID=I3EHM6_NEMP3|nr:uncharacterized protein NEPG_00504 [Nematocida parisii ERTm1]EIJ88723.1 hypothetical protein NEQG_01413 [Nematocida parisii ERTm3]EIJ94979.1 hypothetical protein NEPG_00504 [Nematocida parisii ERTm1]|eukprot:XP_013058335.1 hypothetical protein NEPG_00504 [Nematocida parisii ERTm1]
MSVHIYTRENRADLNMINNYKIKENKIRSKLQEIEQDRPNIICCIKNRSDTMGVDSHGLPVLERTLLSSIELEKKYSLLMDLYMLLKDTCQFVI